MKRLISAILLISFLTTQAEAQVAERESRISRAATLLSDVAESVSPVKLSPNEVKEAMKELAGERHALSAEEFEENWVGNDSDVWGADTASWGFDTAAGAQGYIEAAIKENFIQSEQTDQDKIKYADAMMKVDRAFSLLPPSKHIQYGVAPLGAVQCGVTFAELVILDTRTGEAYEVVMEGSGC